MSFNLWLPRPAAPSLWAAATHWDCLISSERQNNKIRALFTSRRLGTFPSSCNFKKVETCS